MSKGMKGKGKRSLPVLNGSKCNVTDSSILAKRAKAEVNGGLNTKYNFEISEHLQQQTLKENLRKSWESKEENSDHEFGNELTLIKDPFNCCIVKNVISTEAESSWMMTSLIDELEGQEFVEKNNDLYKFVQSGELKCCKDSVIEAMRNLLIEKV